MSVLPSLGHLYAGFLMISFAKSSQNQGLGFQMNLFKSEEIKSGFITQAKHQKSSQLFQNDSINKVQGVCWGTS